MDIDLDFFLNKIPLPDEKSERLDENKYTPWKDETLISFLENRCELSQNKKIKGKIFDQHHKVFFYWKKLISKGKIKTPFEIVHIDAHADLGISDWGWTYIVGELLHLPPEKRTNPKIDDMFGIGEGNYLAFAVACRWISKITFVTPRHWEDDLIDVHFKDFDVNSGIIQLKKYNKDDVYELGEANKLDPIAREPDVLFSIVDIDDFFTKDKFSLINLSLSKEYTPRSSDKLVKIFKSYIKKW